MRKDGTEFIAGGERGSRLDRRVAGRHRRPAGDVISSRVHTAVRPGDLRAAIELAIRAPSIHNSQPWRWRLGIDRVDLFADRTRQLRVVDSSGRALRVSCGAALFQLRAALHAGGWSETTTLMPDPYDPDHLATVMITGRQPVSEDWCALAAAAHRRRTDRRPLSSEPVEPQVVADLCASAADEGAALHRITRSKDQLIIAVALGRADDYETADPIHPAELSRLIRRRHRDALFVLATPGDSAVDQVRAGEALCRVLLTAAAAGLAISPYTQPLEVPAPRLLLRRMLEGCGDPQIVLRVGWPEQGEERPLTRRRPVAEVLEWNTEMTDEKASYHECNGR